MIIFDTETTGLNEVDAINLAKQPHIIEFAAIKLDDETLEEKGRLEFLCNPGFKLPDIIVKITHITDAMLADKPPFSNYYQDLVDFFLGERKLIGHNVMFDVNLLTHELRRLDRLRNFPWPPEHICTVEKTQHIKGYRLKLADLHTMATGEGFKDAHRAMADTEGLVRVVRWLRKQNII